MGKEVFIHIQNGILLKRMRMQKEYYSNAIKRNTFESDLMRQMNLETIKQSEASQKEKHKYCILMHLYGIQIMYGI